MDMLQSIIYLERDAQQKELMTYCRQHLQRSKMRCSMPNHDVGIVGWASL